MRRAAIDLALWWLMALITAVLPAAHVAAGWQHTRRCRTASR